MEISLKLGGKTVFTGKINVQAFLDSLHEAQEEWPEDSEGRSAALTVPQAEALLERINEKSVQFLREIAESPKGVITWSRMREIFGIEDEKNWSAFSSRHGKGITRALRHITGGKHDALFFFDEEEWGTWTEEVFVDGEALNSLRKAFGF